jgi:RNA polymerase sigma-70 factor (ECF subfamily)
MATYNKSLIFKYAWRLFKGQSEKTEAKFNSYLKEAWHLAKTKPSKLVVAVKVVEVKPTFDAMYNEQYNSILRYISLKVIGKGADGMIAEDITSETFIHAYRHYNKFDTSISKLTTWLHKVANGRISDYFRGKEGKTAMSTINVSDYTDEQGNEVFSFESYSNTDDLVNGNELSNKINKAIADLSPKYKQIADLFFIQQLSHEEISEICEIPTNHVKILILRCRIRLQNQLQREKQEYAIAS